MKFGTISTWRKHVILCMAGENEDVTNASVCVCVCVLLCREVTMYMAGCVDGYECQCVAVWLDGWMDIQVD